MIIFLVLFAFIMIFNIVKNKRSLHMLQQNLYNENNRYLKWVKKNIKSVILSFDFISMILLIIACLVDDELVIFFQIAAVIFYVLEIIHVLINRKTEQVKKPLVITARVKRLIITLSILFFIPLIISVVCNKYFNLMLMITSIMTYFSYFIVWIAKVINRPIERMVYLKFYYQAQRKLKSMSNLKVIGITGSYGKTSSKNILNDILNVKYVTKPTPKNLNTEYGLMITINNHLEKFDEIFIAEMGAYKRGEINTLCKMVHPKYGILTRVGLQHLETFGSPENIQKTKFELIESLPSDGIGVLNGDDPKQLSYEIKSQCKKVWIGIENSDVDIRAMDIECSNKGSKFNVYFKDLNEKYPFETSLLGNNNVYNILAGIALGKEFGMSVSDLQRGVRKVKPVEHRLEIKDLGGMYMIDDAYNSNPVGAKMATEVLGMMPGKKVVVTPGMIELGDNQDEYNKEFGKQIAQVADEVILIGEMTTKPIYNGLIEAGYSKDKIHILNDVVESYPLVRSMKDSRDIYALYENDLPDTFNEK